MVDFDRDGKVSLMEIEPTERWALIAVRLRAFVTDNIADLSTEEKLVVQRQVADKFREEIQTIELSGVNKEALFNALYANKND